MNRLDRILSESDAPEPSAGFVAAVMAAVRQTERVPEPLPFPWRWVTGGAVAVLAVALVSLAGGASAAPPALDGELLLALGVLAASGLFSYLAVELS